MLRECIVIASIASRKSVAVARSIKDLLGFKVVGVAHTHHPHIYSRYFDKVHLIEIDRGNVEWIYTVASIAREYRCVAVLPIDSIDFYMFSKYSYVFEDLGITLVSPKHESIVLVSDRVKCYEYLGDVAVFPKQVYVESREDIEKVYELSPPLVVKDVGDASNPTFHLDYVTAIEDVESRVPVVVQEYVEGVARGYYVLSFNGVPILEFMHQRIAEYTPIGGPSLSARGIVRDPLLIDIGRRIVEKLKWSGILMVETRFSEEKEVYYVLELNPKFWGSIDLSESLNYRFSALLLTLYLHGLEKALDLKKRLAVGNGVFVWLLDSFRYIPKIVNVWLYQLNYFIRNPLRSDVDLTDISRNIVQIATAFKRIRRERNLWRKYLDYSKQQLNVWYERFRKYFSADRKALVLDFDGVIVDLPVNWSKVRKELIARGFLYPWESITRALTRYWYRDRDRYQRLSELIEVYEEKAIDNAEPLIDPEIVRDLSNYVEICVASKQPTKVIEKTLSILKLDKAIDKVMARDSGVGPIKKDLYRECVEKLNAKKVLVVDDNLEYLVDAYRQGYVPMMATNRLYLIARSYRLGIPGDKPSRILDTIRKYIKIYMKQG
jgi:predicted ATP-grasp superfamily ATP-dependent carboligase/phosphoglycolate phosphatase-like HAD superfamily hydrolase